MAVLSENRRRARVIDAMLPYQSKRILEIAKPITVLAQASPMLDKMER